MEETNKEYPEYKVGETVIYINGTKAELGIVKKACGGDDYFVNYHTGDTAARTHASHLMKVSNEYAFHITRLDPDGNERKKIIGTTTVDKAFERFMLDACPEVKKKLKALEIIKKKLVSVSEVLMTAGVEYYNNGYSEEFHLTQGEYDLIKEVMKCQ